jgi:hypothetical protein
VEQQGGNTMSLKALLLMQVAHLASLIAAFLRRG